MKALVSGSFDPPTIGHIALIKEAARRYESTVACVMVNAEKEALFDLADRKRMLELCLGDAATVDAYDGMCYKYCADNGIDVIVRGFRNAADYAYETEMAAFNKNHGGVDTVLLQIDGLESITASEARVILKNGGDLSGILPKEVIEYIDGIKNK